MYLDGQSISQNIYMRIKVRSHLALGQMKERKILVASLTFMRYQNLSEIKISGNWGIIHALFYISSPQGQL